MSYLDRIRDCAVFDPAVYLPFRVADTRVGRIHKKFVGELELYSDTFRISKNGVDLADNLETAEKRTRTMDRVLRKLRNDGLVPGWRDEPYPVTTSFRVPALLHLSNVVQGCEMPNEIMSPMRNG